MTGRPHRRYEGAGSRGQTERDVFSRALDYPCDECGAKPGKRCTIMGIEATKWRKPHPDRASLAWQAILRGERSEAA